MHDLLLAVVSKMLYINLDLPGCEVLTKSASFHASGKRSAQDLVWSICECFGYHCWEERSGIEGYCTSCSGHWRPLCYWHTSWLCKASWWQGVAAAEWCQCFVSAAETLFAFTLAVCSYKALLRRFWLTRQHCGDLPPHASAGAADLVCGSFASCTSVWCCWCAVGLHSIDVLLQSLYTGVYSRGGPTNTEPSNELSALLDRSPADVRGVKFSGSPGMSLGIADCAGQARVSWSCFWLIPCSKLCM